MLLRYMYAWNLQRHGGWTWGGGNLSSMSASVSLLGDSAWLIHIQNVLAGAAWIAARVAMESASVLVHCRLASYLEFTWSPPICLLGYQFPSFWYDEDESVLSQKLKLLYFVISWLLSSIAQWWMGQNNPAGFSCMLNAWSILQDICWVPGIPCSQLLVFLCDWLYLSLYLVSPLSYVIFSIDIRLLSKKIGLPLVTRFRTV